MRKITLIALFSFITFQSTAQVLLSENFDTALNWTIAHPTGTSALAGWSRVTTGTNPDCIPFAGDGMARFNSYNITAGNAYSITSPAIPFSGLNYRVKFKMFRDNTYSTDADKIRIYLNTTAAVGGNLIGTVNRSSSLTPVETENGWHSYSFNLPAGISGTKYLSFLGTSAYGNNMFIDEVSVVEVPTNDGEMTAVNFSPVIATIGNNPITGLIKNNGGNDITSIDLNWQVDGGTTYTQSLTGLAIIPGQSYNFNHSDQWNAMAGFHTLRVWLSNTNGNDSDLSNNEIIKSIYVVNELFSKTVVYEEATGTWCQWCPRGLVGLKDMLHNHPDGSFIGIAVHNNDPMVVAAYNSAIGGYISGYPSGTLNRIPVEVDPGLSSIEPAYQAELTRVPLGKITVPDVSWNSTTRQISFEVNSQFALDIAAANYNVAAVIVENGVHGTASGYNQANAYSGSANPLMDWEGVNWNNLPASVPAATMVYNHVGRALLGGFTGVASSVPSAVSYNTLYPYSFTYTLPTTQNENNIEVVAILIDNASGQIVNADNFDLGAKITLATTNFNSKNKISIFPNPSTGILNVNTQNTVEISITDLLGKVMFHSNKITNQTPIDLSGFQKGVYLAKIVGDNTISTEKIILN